MSHSYRRVSVENIYKKCIIRPRGRGLGIVLDARAIKLEIVGEVINDRVMVIDRGQGKWGC